MTISPCKTPTTPSNTISVPWQQPSLEEELSLFVQERLKQGKELPPSFLDQTAFLAPNESPVARMRAHIAELKTAGLAVVTGTERSFFDVILMGELCQGVVCIDICPLAVKYNLFNIMLFKICSTLEEYQAYTEDLTTQPNEDPTIIQGKIQARLEKMRAILLQEKSSLNEMRSFYLENLNDLGAAYYTVKDKLWKADENFEEVYYHKDPTLFALLQRHAKAGNMIAVLGDINDLSFLKTRSISLVDVSNIPDYSIIDLQGPFQSPFRIVWTELYPFGPTRYYSKEYIPETSQERRQELYALRDTLKKAGSFMPKTVQVIMRVGEKELQDFSLLPNAYLTANQGDGIRKIMEVGRDELIACTADKIERIISRLAFYKRHYLVEVADLGLVDMDRLWLSGRLNETTPEKLQQWVKETKQFPERFTEHCVQSWQSLKPEIYFSLKELPGWFDEFETLIGFKSKCTYFQANFLTPGLALLKEAIDEGKFTITPRTEAAELLGYVTQPEVQVSS